MGIYSIWAAPLPIQFNAHMPEKVAEDDSGPLHPIKRTQKRLTAPSFG